MTSLLTNASSMSALSLLSATQRSLSATQAQVSSGLRVATASDNAAYWSIGVGMKSRVSAMAAVSDSLDLTNALLQVTTKGLDTILGAMNGIKADIVQAREPGINRDALQADILARQQVMLSAAADASFNGINLLVNHPVETEKSVEMTSAANNVNFGGGGTDTYDVVVQGQDHRVVDDYSLDPNGVKSYYSVGKVDYNPISTLKSPLSIGGARSGTNTIDIDLDALNMSSSYYTDDDKYSQYPQNYVDSTLVDETDPVFPTNYDESHYERNGEGRNQDIPWNDENNNLLSHPATLHSFNGIYEVNPKSGSLQTPGLQFGDNTVRYDYGYSLSDYQPSLGEDITVTPVTDIVHLSVADRTIRGSDPDLPKKYVLTNGDLDSLSTMVEGDISQVISASAKVGSYMTLVANEKDFSAKLSDALTTGIGSLTDADMNVASTRLQALQTQQQIGIQSLSIANQNGQLVLKLFGATA